MHQMKRLNCFSKGLGRITWNPGANSCNFPKLRCSPGIGFPLGKRLSMHRITLRVIDNGIGYDQHGPVAGPLAVKLNAFGFGRIKNLYTRRDFFFKTLESLFDYR